MLKYLNLSVGKIYVISNSTNELKFSFLSSTGIGNFDNFTNKTLTIQQYNPSNPSAVYPSYDVKTVIDKKDGVIDLLDLEGTYNSEEVYAYFKVSFS